MMFLSITNNFHYFTVLAFFAKECGILLGYHKPTSRGKCLNTLPKCFQVAAITQQKIVNSCHSEKLSPDCQNQTYRPTDLQSNSKIKTWKKSSGEQFGFVNRANEAISLFSELLQFDLSKET